MRKTMSSPDGGLSGGAIVAGWRAQMPGSMCKAPPVTASLICCR